MTTASSANADYAKGWAVPPPPTGGTEEACPAQPPSWYEPPADSVGRPWPMDGKRRETLGVRWTHDVGSGAPGKPLEGVTRGPLYTAGMRKIVVLLLLALPALSQEHVDLGIVDRVKAEAFERSKVMETLRNLTDVHGPRLTGSPGFEDAARWAIGELNGYGLEKVHLEKWGPFGRAWSLEQSSLELIEPRYSQLTAVPLAWSASSNGPVTGELVLAPLRGSFRDGPKKYQEAMQAYRARWAGKLRGKIVLLSEPKVPAPQSNPLFRRYTAAELADMANAPAPAGKLAARRLDELEWPEDPAEMGKFFSSLPNMLMEQLYDLYDQAAAERGEFFAREGVAGVLMEDERAHDGMLFSEAAGAFKAASTPAPPTFVVTAEQYNRIARLVDKKTPARVRLSLKATMSDRDVDGLNIIGEIPGGDRKDEIVMVGAHFDR